MTFFFRNTHVEEHNSQNMLTNTIFYKQFVTFYLYSNLHRMLHINYVTLYFMLHAFVINDLFIHQSVIKSTADCKTEETVTQHL